ncbi:MAG: Wadjet anti-phage system protein JetA family protein [Poseidonibacter sp.]|uniref:Wadjet anti-phage system protein JetA family protein n=1 Tax=Poseidonibacter sp. TaxID=2321188 RepID=UPI00359EBA9F
MLVTQNHPDFFNVLTGANNKIIEQSIISLYGALYGNDFIVDETLDRKKVRDIVYSVIQEIPWQGDDEQNFLDEDKDKASYIIRRLKDCGWIDFIMDKALLIKTFNFTKNGKKFAQLLFSSSDEENILVRQRNVRATKASLESYKKSDDPADLIDAINFSKYIVSDLTDNINDLRDEKNLLMQLAMEDVKVAGGKFIDFVKDKFASDIAIKFGKDSANRHILDIEEIVKDLSLDGLELRQKRLLAHFPMYRKNPNALKNILDAIDFRLKNACDIKLPQLKKEISSYIQRGTVIFRQTNSLFFNKNKEVLKIANVLKNKPKDEKLKLLEDIGKAVKYPNLRLLNLNAVKIRRKSKKDEAVSFLPAEVTMPIEAYIKSNFEQKKHLSFSYSQKEIRAYIERHFEEAQSLTITNNCFKITNPKEMLIALYATDIMRQDKENFEVTYTGNKCENIYFKTDEYIIRKKEKISGN